MSLFPTKCPWEKYRWIRGIYNERADCAVVTLAQLTGVTYQSAHKALKQAGRKSRTGTWPSEMRKAFDLLGFALDDYPFTGKTVQAAVGSLPNCSAFLLTLSAHYTGYIEGKWLDHKPINKRKILGVHQVIPK